MQQPGNDGDSLPVGVSVFRVGNNSHISAEYERQKVLPGLFELTEADKRSPEKRLSVWAEYLTVADQAWIFMGSKPRNTYVVCLEVDRVREIVPPDGFASLDVVWERALNPDGTENNSPGAGGHSAICNLHQGGTGKQDKARRLRLRMKLAEIARLSPVPVPHDFPEAEVQATAERQSKANGHAGASSEELRIQAIRYLRREKVRQHRGTQESVTSEPRLPVSEV